MYVTDHLALAADDTDSALRELVDRHEIVDALHRFGLGQDLRDRALFCSAFAADAELDFRPAAAKCGIDSALMSGRENIVSTILGMLAQIDTTHVVTNCRVRIDGDVARATAIVEAQHLPTADHTRHVLLKNMYDVGLVRDGRRWVMRRVRIDNVWYTGDPQILLGR